MSDYATEVAVTPLDSFKKSMEDAGFSDAMVNANVRAVERFFKFALTGIVDAPWVMGTDPIK